MYLFIYTLKNSTFFEELMVKLQHIILDKRQNMSHRSTQKHFESINRLHKFLFIPLRRLKHRSTLGFKWAHSWCFGFTFWELTNDEKNIYVDGFIFLSLHFNMSNNHRHFGKCALFLIFCSQGNIVIFSNKTF